MTNETRLFVNSVAIVLITTFLSTVATWYWLHRSEKIKKAEAIALEHDRLVERIIELEKQLALVNQSIVPISTAFQAILVKELTHPHAIELDGLLAKIGPPFILTLDEEARLYVLLLERSTDETTEELERDAALILPLVMKRAKRELEEFNKNATIVTMVAMKAKNEPNPSGSSGVDNSMEPHPSRRISD